MKRIWVGLIVMGLMIGCAKSKEEPKALIDDKSPLYVQEKEEFIVDISKSSPGVVFSEKLGVGVNSPKTKAYKFDCILKDRIPFESQVISPQGERLQTKTIYGNPYSIPWTLDIDQKEKIISFALMDLPAIDLSRVGSCCGCSGECASACSIEFYYQTTTNLSPDKWAEVSYKVEPEILKINKENEVKITLIITNKSLNNPWCNFTIPKKVNGVEIELVDYPTDMRKMGYRNLIMVQKKLEKKKEKVKILLKMTPIKEGTLTLDELIQVGGNLGGLIYPTVRTITSRRVEKTTTSSVIYKGNIALRAK